MRIDIVNSTFGNHVSSRHDKENGLSIHEHQCHVIVIVQVHMPFHVHTVLLILLTPARESGIARAAHCGRAGALAGSDELEHEPPAQDTRRRSVNFTTTTVAAAARRHNWIIFPQEYLSTAGCCDTEHYPECPGNHSAMNGSEGKQAQPAVSTGPRMSTGRAWKLPIGCEAWYSLNVCGALLG
eukprot:m.160566 g.160566  ORF g.160566 m.160566 type:complete len:183 (+) comp18029_c0_seq6:759-1307(+)